MQKKCAHEDTDLPYHFVHNLCREANTPGFRFLERSTDFDCNIDPLQNVARYVQESAVGANKLRTYTTELNPAMSVHQIYRTNEFIEDYKRESFTRLRLMSHNLRIEVGRWSRTPAAQRVCQCDDEHVQTEQHFMIECSISAHYRQRFAMLSFTNIKSLLEENIHVSELCNYIHKVLSIYT